MPLIDLPDDELDALTSLFAADARMDWAAYDRARLTLFRAGLAARARRTERAQTRESSVESA